MPQLSGMIATFVFVQYERNAVVIYGLFIQSQCFNLAGSQLRASAISQLFDSSIRHWSHFLLAFGWVFLISPLTCDCAWSRRYLVDRLADMKLLHVFVFSFTMSSWFAMMIIYRGSDSFAASTLTYFSPIDFGFDLPSFHLYRLDACIVKRAVIKTLKSQAISPSTGPDFVHRRADFAFAQ